MARATQAIIHLRAIEHNYVLAKKQSPSASVYAVIKANAYGHGLIEVGSALNAVVDGLAVACVDEAEQLRRAGVDVPIMVLEGAYDEAECLAASDAGYELVLHQPQQVQWLASVKQPLNLWIKVDTGMHRLGFPLQEVASTLQHLQQLQKQTGVAHNLALMSHFASADMPQAPINQLQLSRFNQLARFKLPMSMCNSAALLSFENAHGQRLRPGIMLYGASPLADRSAQSLTLKPAMTLCSKVIAVHEIEAGEFVGYGQTWQAKQKSTVAVVAIGYGDGYPRMAPNGTPVLINGQRGQLAGRVSMDMITVDVSNVRDVKVGDYVELWGENLPADEIAQYCQTIAYELFCQITQRVPRVYQT